MYIQSFCHIHDRRVIVDGQIRFEAADPQTSATDFLADAFRHTGIDYRKFYKMDPLARLGFLAAELILPPPTADEQPKEDMGIICFNSTSSLAADRIYQRTIPAGDDFFPSPADFVYTLPNIVTGEIAIRHKIQGETMFYVLPTFCPDTIYYIACEAIEEAGLRRLLIGWIDADIDRLEARVLLCGTQSMGLGRRFTHGAINNLFP